jgi:hypothetical protein
MTNLSTSTKSNPFRRYALAAARCKRLSGDALNKVLDDERDAIQAITASGTIAQKIDVLLAVLKEASAWTDGRDVRLARSIQRDMQAIA